MAVKSASPSTEESKSRQSSPESTPPSSPVSDMGGKRNKPVGAPVDADTKYNGLINLLKRSSVLSAMMEEKIAKERKDQREKAAKQARKVSGDRESKSETTEVRRSTRTTNDESPDAPASNSKELPSRRKVSPKDKKAKSQNNLLAYFDKQGEAGDGKTVAEALQESSNDDEENTAPALDSTYQPELVTGGTMRPYQLEGLEWLKTIYLHGSSGILADEMGLGKTIQAISMVAFLKQEGIKGPFIVIAPLSTVENWINEFARWTPTIKTVKYYGNKTERSNIRRKHMQLNKQQSDAFPVIVTSYQMAMNDRPALAKYSWQYMIVDEGHRLKNMDCKLVKDLLTYSTTNRLLITGTPLQNNLAELWSLLHFTVPEMFDDLSMFENWFEMYAENQDGEENDKAKQVVALMHGILKPVLLRRLKTDVESNLPPKREYVLWAPLMKEQKEIYRAILDGNIRLHLENKAFERLETDKGRTPKRKGSFSGTSTPNKSVKTSGTSTPAHMTEELPSKRKSRGPMSYVDLTDATFDQELAKLEKGQQNELDGDKKAGEQVVDGAEKELISRSESLARARKEVANMRLKNPIMQFRLVCNSPHLFYWPWGIERPDFVDAVDESLVSASGKLLLLDQLLPRLFAEGHKVLIFSQFTSTLDILAEYLITLRGIYPCRIDGSTGQEDRADIIDQFNTDEKTNVFLLTTRAGGVGINLTAADTVILFDSDWNPQQDLQAIDRAHRIGQTRPVVIYRLATKETVEELLLKRAETKRKLEKSVIHKGKFKSMLEDGSSADDINTRDLEAKAYIFAKGTSALEANDDLDDAPEIPKNREYRARKRNTPSKRSPPSKSFKAFKHKQILTEADLAVLTDRTPGAYERAAEGKDAVGEHGAFRATETKRTKEMDGIEVEEGEGGEDAEDVEDVEDGSEAEAEVDL